MIDETVCQKAKYIAEAARVAGFDAPIIIQHEMFHDEFLRENRRLGPTIIPWELEQYVSSGRISIGIQPEFIRS